MVLDIGTIPGIETKYFKGNLIDNTFKENFNNNIFKENFVDCIFKENFMDNTS